MLAVALSLVLALVLLVSAGMKLASGPAGRAALATYGIRGEPLASVAWAALGAIEAGLAVCLVDRGGGRRLGDRRAVHGLLRRPGRRADAGPRRRAVRVLRGQGPRRPRLGRPRRAAGRGARARCRCSTARAPTTEEWLALGLAVALLGIAALAVVLLALAREVGMLRLSVAPAGRARGRPRGPGGRRRAARSPTRFGAPRRTHRARRLHLRGLRHVPRPRARGRRASARTRASCCAPSTRSRDADAWAAADVPGSPFAVALDADGTVLAKGTFNTGASSSRCSRPRSGGAGR